MPLDALPPGPFRIGQVTEATGLSASTIRTWERRYQVVEPQRTDKGTRQYSRQEVQRLHLIKQLTDAGEAVGVLAELDDDALQQRLSPSPPSSTVERNRVVLIHRSIAGSRPDDPVDIVASSDRPDGIAAGTSASVVVVELELLGLDPITELIALRGRLRQARPLVLAAFVPRSTRAALEAAGAEIMRAPATREDILSRCRTMAAPRLQHTEPQFDRATLQFLLDVRPNNPCECPSHLASLALSIQAFEEYSRHCVEAGGADVVLHTELAEESAILRVHVEALLRRVCAHDGITLPLPTRPEAILGG